MKTLDEMCMNFIYYYPKADFLTCGSAHTAEELANFYNKLIK